MRFPTLWYVRPAMAQTSMRLALIDLFSLLEYSMSVKLLPEHTLGVLSLKGGCTRSSESIFIKMSHCLKSLVMAHLIWIHII